MTDGAAPSDAEREPGGPDGPRRPRTVVDWIVAFVPLLISVALVAAVWSAFGGLSALRGANWGWFALAGVLSVLVNAYLGAFKWGMTLDACAFPVDRRLLRRLWIGLLPATFFTPFQSGHVLYGVALWRATGAHPVRAGECVAYDKYLSLIGTFALVAVGLVLVPPGVVPGRVWIAAVCAAAVVAFFFDHLAIRLLARFEVVRRHSGLVHQAIGPLTKARLLLLAMAYQSSDTVSALLACAAIGALDQPLVVLGVAPLAMLLSYAPITVSGFGARDALFVVLLGTAMTTEQAVVVAASVNVLEYVLPAVFGLTELRPLVAVLRRGADR